MPLCTVATGANRCRFASLFKNLKGPGMSSPEAVDSTIAGRSSTEAVDRRYIDEVLSIADGHLWIEGCDTVRIASQYGTPLYRVSETQLRANCRERADLV